jgi:hypothetical protein
VLERLSPCTRSRDKLDMRRRKVSCEEQNKQTSEIKQRGDGKSNTVQFWAFFIGRK